MQSTNEKYFLNGIKAFFSTLVSLWTLDVLVNYSIIEELYLRRPPQAGPVDFLGLFLAEIEIAFVVVAVCWLISGVASVLFKARHKTNHAVILLSSVVVALTIFVNASKFGTQSPLVAAIAGMVIGGTTWVLFHFKVRDITDRGTFGEIMQAVLYPAMIIGLASQVFAGVVAGRIETAVLNAVIAAITIAALTVLIFFQTRVVRVALRWLPICAAVVFSGHVIGSAAGYGVNVDKRYRDPARKRPSIILIVLDSVRADHLQRFGYPRNTMPALEQWAQDAVVATRAVSPSGWTSPALASIFSGLPVSLHGIHYGMSTDLFATPAVDGITWLPRQLTRIGYYSVAVAANPLALPAADMGFTRVLDPTRDVWASMSLANQVDQRIAVLRRVNERLRWRMPYVDAGRMVGIIKRAVPAGDGPVLLFINLADAHSPYNPPEEALELLGVRPDRAFRRYDDHRRLTRDWRNLPPSTQRSLGELYDGELRWIDLNLTTILEWVDERYGGEAVVIVTSDHGEELGEHGRVGHEFGLPQTLIHVPLFVKAPYLNAGEIDAVISTRSLYDYILKLAYGETPDLATIAETDTFGVICERYPSGRSIESLPGTGYERPWVALFENESKGIGPSQYGFEYFGFDSTAFYREKELVADSTVTSGLRERVDRYWETYRDRREESGFGETSEAMSKKLRSFGYIK
jgi:arylsulfatase A-like enzyme